MTIEVVNHTNREVSIRNFDTDRYVSEPVMEQEWAQIWRRTWLVAGLQSDVAKPGDYFVFDLGREQILVVCSSDGGVQSYYNVLTNNNKCIRS